MYTQTRTRIGYKFNIHNENNLEIVAKFALLFSLLFYEFGPLYVYTARAIHVQALKIQNFKLVIWKFAIAIEYRRTPCSVSPLTECYWC